MPVKLREVTMKVLENEVKRFPWIAYCTEYDCYFTVSARDEDQAHRHLGMHSCPYGGATGRLAGKSLLSAMWRALDECVDGIMLAKTDATAVPPEKLAHYKSRAGGIATCLYISLGGNEGYPWYYDSQDDITREALRRYKIRIGEAEYEPTQGDGYDALRDGPTPRWAGTVARLRGLSESMTKKVSSSPAPSPPSRKVAKPRRSPMVTVPAPVTLATPKNPLLFVPGAGIPGATVKPKLKLPDDVLNGIRSALSAGNMDDRLIANIFQVTVEDVQILRGEADE